MKIGIFALQGDFAAHAEMLRKIGVEPVLVKRKAHLVGISGLIFPGGESSTHIKLLHKSDMKPEIESYLADGRPAMGTCAGLILLARQIVNVDQYRFAVLDVVVERNAYGSQRESFETTADIPVLQAENFPCVFIRAPKIKEVGSDVDVLARHGGDPILVRCENILGATFHPELTDDLRIHEFFIRICEKGV